MPSFLFLYVLVSKGICFVRYKVSVRMDIVSVRLCPLFGYADTCITDYGLEAKVCLLSLFTLIKTKAKHQCLVASAFFIVDFVVNIVLA